MARQIASEYPVLEPQPSQERRRWSIFRCRRPPMDEDIFGKKWVTLTDPGGNRCAFQNLIRVQIKAALRPAQL